MPYATSAISTSTELSDAEHGLHLINELELQDEYYCPIMCELLLDPYQATCCGRRISKQALQRLNKTTCPWCKSTQFGSYPDRGFERKVKKLKVRCQYSDQGCRWEGCLDELEQHNQQSKDYHSTLKTITSIVPQEFTLNKFDEFRKSKKPWFSPSFYTQLLGYRMCLRVNIEDNDSCLSVYIYLMRGVNDNNLVFPFRGKVLVQLLNQKSGKHHETFIVFDDSVDVKHTMRVTDRERQELGYGNRMFIPINKILAGDLTHEYLQQGNLTFRVTVVNDIPEGAYMQHQGVVIILVLLNINYYFLNIVAVLMGTKKHRITMWTTLLLQL